MDTMQLKSRKNARSGKTISKKNLISSMTLTLNLHYFEDKSRRSDCYLVHILNEISSTSSVVFTHTCKDTQRVALMLGNLGVRAIPILGQMVQAERLAAVNMFNSGECNILVCSDVGIRGLDIPSVDTVINYAIPPIAEVRN
ncbi:DEAD-box ATP-dependent RNA helicase 10 [Tanacetum coccineum]